MWQFLGDIGRTKFAARIQHAGVRCLMEVDDNYLIPPPSVPGIRRPWHLTVKDSLKEGGTGYSHQAHRLLLPSIDGLIVSTDELANAYEGLVPAGIHVCPNSVDPDDWPEIERVERTLVVGYAGSDSHFYDLFDVERALDWASRAGFTLMKMGAAANHWPWPHESLPWTDDIIEYHRNLQSIDIGLCPLRRSKWHDSKSDIKAMEYLMAGALPIVQADSPVYKDWLGVVPSASTPKEWVRVLKEICYLSSDERRAMWQGAYDYLMAHKTISSHIDKWRRAIGD